MRGGWVQEPIQHRLNPGDEHVEWLPYGELYRRYRITRGAMDKLKMKAAVRWVDGDDLLRFLKQRHAQLLAKGRAWETGTELDAVLAGEVYYALDDLAKFVTADAARRLGAPDALIQEVRAALLDHHGHVAFTDATLKECSKCAAKAPMEHLDAMGRCPRCQR